MNESYGNGKPPSDEDTPGKKTLMRSMSDMVSGLSSSIIDWLYKNDETNNVPRTSANYQNQSTPSTSRHDPPDNVRESLFGARERTLDDTSSWTRKRTYEQVGDGYTTSTPNEYVNRSDRSDTTKNLNNQSTQQINPRSYSDINIRPQTVIVSTPLSRERSVLVTESSSRTTSPETYTSSSHTYTSSSPKYSTNSSQQHTPFYPGRTTYGGLAAASYNVPLKRRRLSITPLEEDTTDNYVSQATKRICQVLDNIQRPILDASIAPLSPSRSVMNSTSSSMKMTNNYIKEKYGNRYKPLYVNNNVKVNEYFAKLQGSTSRARQIIASLSSSVDEIPTLRTDRNIIKNTNTTVKNTKEADGKKEAESAKAAESTKEADSKKEAAVQVDISAPSASKAEVPFVPDVKISITQEFSFSSPITASKAWVSDNNDNLVVSTKSSVTDNRSKPVVFNYVDRQTDKISTKWRCDTCLVDNDDKVDKCVCCTASKPSALAQSTVAPIPFKVTSDLKEKGNKWRCETCLVENDDKHEKCVCCTASKPSASGKQSSAQLTPKVTNDLTVKTKKWRCETCLVENDDIVEKCVCCGGNKPSTLQPPLKVTSEQKKWRCDTCLVENNDTVDICVCCGGNKKGGVAQSKPVVPEPSNKIPTEPDSVFKEIFKAQAARWECLSCFSRNDSDRDKCICCETARPGTKKETEAPKQFNFGTVPCGFKFGIPNNEVNINKQKEQDSATNKNFVIKIPSQTSVEVAKTEAPKLPAMFSFGIPSTATATPPVNTETPADTIVKTNEISKTITPAISDLLHKPEETKQPEPPPQMFIPTATIAIAKPNNVINTLEVKPFAKIKLSNQLISNTTTATVTTSQLSIPSFTSATFSMPTTVTNSQPPMASIAPVTNSIFELPKPELQTEPKPASSGFKFTFGTIQPANANDEPGKAAVLTSSVTSNPLSINSMPLMNQPASFTAPSAQTTNSFGLSQTSIFGAPTPNIFTANTQANVTPSTTIMFGANMQSTAPPVTTSAFTFGVTSNTQPNNAFEPMKSTPTFNIPNSTIFGGSNPPASNTNATPFGTAPNTSMFGSNAQNNSTFLTTQFPTQQPLNNNLQGSIFANNTAPQETKSPFGIATHTTFPLSSTPAQPAPNAFGFPTTTQTTPMFGVVAPQPISGSGGFNFTLGQQPQQQSTPGVYNFGGAVPQFNMGSSSTPGIGAAGLTSGTTGRRVRRAVRRTTPR